jgi:hypothetical protein
MGWSEIGQGPPTVQTRPFLHYGSSADMDSFNRNVGLVPKGDNEADEQYAHL